MPKKRAEWDTNGIYPEIMEGISLTDDTIPSATMADSTQRAELTREVERMKDSLFHTVLEMHNQLIELRRSFAKVQNRLVESEEKRDKAETELQSMKEVLEAQRKAAQNQDQRVSELERSFEAMRMELSKQS